MMKTSFPDLNAQTIESGLCARCGTCVGICPVNAIELDENAYPYLAGECVQCGLCFTCCPGSDIDLPSISKRLFNTDYNLMNSHRHDEHHYVGHSTNDRIRSAGASGGVVTGLLVSMLERGMINGAVVVGMDKKRPYRSKGVLAKTKEEIVEASQSKYCITPSMEVLRYLRKEKGQFAVMGLPCQVQALRKMEAVGSELSRKICCILGLYCHCNLDLNSSTEVIQASGIHLEDVKEFKHRGGRWPGGFWVAENDREGRLIHETGMRTGLNMMVRLFGASRCHLCVDALAEFADLSFGDFWANDYQNDFSSLEKCTLISQKTSRGKAVMEDVMQNGDIFLRKLPGERFSKRISNMERRKKMHAVVRMRCNHLKNVPTPNYHTTVPKPTFKARRSELCYQIWFIIRSHVSIRWLMLKILSTQLGAKLDQMNTLRKKYQYRFYDN